MKTTSRFVRLAAVAIIASLMPVNDLFAASRDNAEATEGIVLLGEPVVCVGHTQPAEADTAALLAAIHRAHSKAGFTALEDYLRLHSESPWAPSLRSIMAYFYRRSGAYTRALDHWD